MLLILITDCMFVYATVCSCACVVYCFLLCCLYMFHLVLFYDWLACGTWLRNAQTFMPVNYDWRSVFLLFGTGSLVRVRAVRVRIIGLGGSKSFIAHCRQAIIWHRLPAGDTGRMNKYVMRWAIFGLRFAGRWRHFVDVICQRWPHPRCRVTYIHSNRGSCAWRPPVNGNWSFH